MLSTLNFVESFWQKRTLLNYLLYPFSIIWLLLSWLRKLQKPYISKTFVVCVGNINLGGSGKTPTAILLSKELTKEGFKVCFLTKGYKGTIHYPTIVQSVHNVSETGDEAMLLKEHATTIVSKSWKKGLQFIDSLNFDVVILDDGYQNPSINKHYNVLVMNYSYGFGNTMIFPCGPLRQSIVGGIKQANSIVVLEQESQALDVSIYNFKKPIYRGHYIAINTHEIKGSVHAFCGIGMPNKFLQTIKNNGIEVKQFTKFHDHHSYSNQDIINLISTAEKNNLSLLTTSKDYVKIPDKYKQNIQVLKIELQLLDIIKLKNDIIEKIIQQNKQKKY